MLRGMEAPFQLVGIVYVAAVQVLELGRAHATSG
jgi:hypothetical protein